MERRGLEQKELKMLNHEAKKRVCDGGEGGGLSEKGRKRLTMRQKRGLRWRRKREVKRKTAENALP
jgi:hypothetical protein